MGRFHHGRIHTAGWTVTKTGPGQALIVHHEEGCREASAPCGQSIEGLIDPIDTGPECGCSDWRSDADMEAMFQGDEKQIFPSGLFPFEWSEAMTPALEWIAEQVEEARDYFEHGIDRRAHQSKTSLHFEDDETPKIREAPVTEPPICYGERESAKDLIPFLDRLPGLQSRQGKQAAQRPRPGSSNALPPGPVRSGLFPCPMTGLPITDRAQSPDGPERRKTRPALPQPLVAARFDCKPRRPGSRRTLHALARPLVAACFDRGHRRRGSRRTPPPARTSCHCLL